MPERTLGQNQVICNLYLDAVNLIYKYILKWEPGAWKSKSKPNMMVPKNFPWKSPNSMQIWIHLRSTQKQKQAQQTQQTTNYVYQELSWTNIQRSRKFDVHEVGYINLMYMKFYIYIYIYIQKSFKNSFFGAWFFKERWLYTESLCITGY
jgi:hypothetical protein